MSLSLNRTYLPSLTPGSRPARSSVRTQLSGTPGHSASSPVCQKILRIAHAFAVMLAAAAGAALGEKPRREEREDAGNLIDRDTPRPVDDRRVHRLLRISHSGPRRL